MPILKKLLEFQKQDVSIVKNGSNPHYKSKYATLNEVLEKVKKPLNDLGVLIVQRPQENGLITELIDTDDDTKIDCFMPYVEVTNAQKLGSSNTYNRRYSLVTLLGLEDEDDDGNVASSGNTSYEPVTGGLKCPKCGKTHNGKFPKCIDCWKKDKELSETNVTEEVIQEIPF
jgi:hypothetical protein